MDNLCNLFFEFSNKDRLRIMRELNKQAMSVTGLSNSLGIRIQESSRHLSRLAEAGVTHRDEGLHNLTLFGKLVLKQLNGLEFISQHRNYFMTHSLERLPPEFVCRLCDLSDSRHSDDISVTFFNVDKIISSAEKFIWLITDNYLLSSMPLLGEALERGVKVLNIEPKDLVPSPDIVEALLADEQTRKSLIQGRIKGLLDERVLQQLDIYFYISDKGLATIAFPVLDTGTLTRFRRFDYLGFTAADKRSHKWCRDLFRYYWRRAQPREILIDELCSWIERRLPVLNTLRKIAAGKEISWGKEVISELEDNYLINQGKLTILGLRVLAKLQQ